MNFGQYRATSYKKAASKKSLVPLFLSLILLAACGGGSSGGGNSSENGSNSDNSDNGNNGSGFDTEVPEDSLPLNRSNATAVALHISRLVLDVEDLASAINIGVILSNADRQSTGTVRGITSFMRPRRISVYGECESGSVSLNGNNDLIFDDCEYSNSLYDGVVELNLVISGEPAAGGNYSFAGDGVADAFMIKQGNRTVRIDGAFDADNGTVEDTEVPGGVSTGIDGIVGEVPLYFNEDGETTRLAGGYDAQFTSDHASASPLRYTQSLDGRVASTLLGGQVTISSSPFSGTDNNFPGSGELEIFGANNSMVLLEVLNEDSVRISADSNGDDDFDDADDSQETMTWQAFLGI